MLDLWPTDIAAPRIKAPVTILKEQAALLDSKTNNTVQAKVDRKDLVSDKPNDYKDKLIYDFTLVAPALGDYSFRLLRIIHDIEMYPIEVFFDDDINDNPTPTQLLTKSEREFIEVLRKVFGSKKTKRVVHAMLAQSIDITE